MDVKILSGDKKTETTCDVCSEIEEIGEPAKVFCFNCQQHLCSLCANCHRKQTATTSHKLTQIEAGIQQPKKANKPSDNMCIQHQDEQIKLFCKDCKTAVCLMCFVDVHQMHNCAKIEKVADEYYERLDEDVVQVTSQIEEIFKKEIEIGKEKLKIVDQCKNVEESILIRGGELKSLIDSQISALLQELSSRKKQKLKEISIVEEELERKKVILEAFYKDCEKTRQNGTASEICLQADDLHITATKLKEMEQDWSCSFSTVKFTPSVPSQSDVNLIGQLSVETNQRDTSNCGYQAGTLLNSY